MLMIAFLKYDLYAVMKLQSNQIFFGEIESLAVSMLWSENNLVVFLCHFIRRLTRDFSVRTI